MSILQNDANFDFSDVYWANATGGENIIINQGGTDSGKTYAILQILIIIAISTIAPKEDPVITIVAESMTNIRKGAYRTFAGIFAKYEYLTGFISSWNETNKTVTFKSGWIIEFCSYENEQQAKQGKRQYLFINEAQSLIWPIFWQLSKRTRIRTFIDYNPTAPFWAHEKLIGTGPSSNDLTATVKLIISDHRHNRFLSEEDHKKTEGIKDTELWRVYARGLTGNLTGLIFPEWQMIPDEQFPKDTECWGALDFGYTNDPTAGIKLTRIGETIYLHEICYTPGIAPIQMKSLLNANGLKDKPIYCEHDPDQIVQLRALDIYAYPARKGQGSVNAGIIKCKEYKIFYTESSKNIHTEKTKYMWQMDPDTGKPTNTPIDAFNHCMDAIRYGIYTHLYRE